MASPGTGTRNAEDGPVDGLNREVVLLSHTIERGVLLITPGAATDTEEKAALAAHISDLVHTYQPFPVVIVLEGPAAAGATVDAVVEAHQACAHLGVLVSVTADNAPARRRLEAGADPEGARLVVHARVDTAVAAAYAAAA
ncbi:hypothetical protein [Streptomyces sp. NPDC054842]